MKFYKNVAGGVSESDLKRALNMKLFLNSFTLCPSYVSALNFFNISREKPVFRKKKNVHFSLSLCVRKALSVSNGVGTAFLSKLNLFLHLATVLRRAYMVDTGTFSLFKRNIMRLYLVNPHLIALYLDGDTYFLNSFSNKLFITVDFYSHNPLFRKLLASATK